MFMDQADATFAQPIELDLDVREVRAAIAARFYADHFGRLDARLVSQNGDVRYYRVNWWRTQFESGNDYIADSAFVRVEKTADGYTVDEVTHGVRHEAEHEERLAA